MNTGCAGSDEVGAKVLCSGAELVQINERVRDNQVHARYFFLKYVLFPGILIQNGSCARMISNLMFLTSII